jgi:D-threo-aldose 1-dehydrogenase
MLERFVAAADLDVVLLAGRWTLLDQTGEALLDLCAARGVSVVIGGVFNSGLLAEPIEGATFDYLVAPDELVERARHLRTQAERSGTTLTALSLAFSGAHEAVTSILVGCRSASELTANVGAFESPPDAATLDVLSGLTWE